MPYNYFPTGYSPMMPYNAQIQPQDAFSQPQQMNVQPLAPNTAIVLWDINDPCVYRKQADATGKPTLKIYDLVERNVSDVKKKSEYPTLDAFNDLKDEVRKIKEALNSHASESST